MFFYIVKIEKKSFKGWNLQYFKNKVDDILLVNPNKKIKCIYSLYLLDYLLRNVFPNKNINALSLCLLA